MSPRPDRISKPKENNLSTLALYVQGDIYPSQNTDPAAVVAAITGSKLTTPILALCHVNCSTETCPNGQSPPGSQDGDLTFNDTLIVRGGQYVGDSNWPGIIKSLRAGQVTKIFASFGGYDVPDYQRIGEIMAKYGTGSDSPLYQNFACLKETLGIDGIDFNDEDSYVQATVVQFAKMLIGLGYEITLPLRVAKLLVGLHPGVGCCQRELVEPAMLCRRKIQQPRRLDRHGGARRSRRVRKLLLPTNDVLLAASQ